MHGHFSCEWKTSVDDFYSDAFVCYDVFFSLSICVYLRCKIHRRRSCDTEIAHTRCRLLTFFLLTISLFIYRFSLIASLSSHPWCVLLLFKFNFQLNSIQTHWNRVPYLHSMATLLSNLVLKCFSKLQIANCHSPLLHNNLSAFQLNKLDSCWNEAVGAERNCGVDWVWSFPIKINVKCSLSPLIFFLFLKCYVCSLCALLFHLHDPNIINAVSIYRHRWNGPNGTKPLRSQFTAVAAGLESTAAKINQYTQHNKFCVTS